MWSSGCSGRWPACTRVSSWACSCGSTFHENSEYSLACEYSRVGLASYLQPDNALTSLHGVDQHGFLTAAPAHACTLRRARARPRRRADAVLDARVDAGRGPLASCTTRRPAGPSCPCASSSAPYFCCRYTCALPRWAARRARTRNRCLSVCAVVRIPAGANGQPHGLSRDSARTLNRSVGRFGWRAG